MPSLRKTRPYDPVVTPGGVFVASAMLSYRPKEGMEFAVGRDMLPQGLIIPDQTTYIKARNRLGFYDVPTQAKAFFWGKRWLVAPFAFAPSYRELRPARESGGGLMAEADLLGKGKTIVGINALRGNDHLGHRSMTGLYTRLGFGSWGILAEHDFTRRRLNQAARFNQQASYLRTFYYWREWLVPSVVLERLTVQRPYAENLWAYKGDVSASLSNRFTIGLRAGVQRDFRTGTLSREVARAWVSLISSVRRPGKADSSKMVETRSATPGMRALKLQHSASGGPVRFTGRAKTGRTAQPEALEEPHESAAGADAAHDGIDRRNLVQDRLAREFDAFLPSQFSNPDNVLAHQVNTARERPQ